MKAFLERLEIEQEDLDVKIYKLVIFLKTEVFNTLTQQMQDLLKSQLEIEYELSKILIKRIELIHAQEG